MRNKLRFFAVIIVICFLFYMRNDPQDAKMKQIKFHRILLHP